jgi:hypothetical protein
MSQKGKKVKAVSFCLFALFVLIGIIVYFRMMPTVNEIRLASGVSVVAETGGRHEIIATGYSEKSDVRFRIKEISGESKVVDVSLTLDKKRYASGDGGGLSYYTVVVPSLEELLNIPRDQQFAFAVEWESHENVEVILKRYKN